MSSGKIKLWRAAPQSIISTSSIILKTMASCRARSIEPLGKHSCSCLSPRYEIIAELSLRISSPSIKTGTLPDLFKFLTSWLPGFKGKCSYFISISSSIHITRNALLCGIPNTLYKNFYPNFPANQKIYFLIL